MTIHTSHFSELSAGELYGILKLRSSVFVVEQDCVYQDLDDRDIDAWHSWMEDGGEVVACLRVFRLDGTHSQIGRVVTAREIRGTGIGKRMMEEGVRIAGEMFPGSAGPYPRPGICKGLLRKVRFHSHFRAIRRGRNTTSRDGTPLIWAWKMKGKTDNGTC